jgi:hypothetical protein
VVRRSVTFVLAFVVGYRAAYVVVDTVGGAALDFPWRQSPRMLAGEASSVVREHLTDPVKGRVADLRAAVGEGRQAMRHRESELRAENGLRLRRSS